MKLKAVAVLVGAVAVFATTSSVQADQIPLEHLMSHNMLVLRLAGMNAMNVINWKVGDSANYNITAGSYGQVGTMTESVTKDEGASIWIEEKSAMQGQNDTVDEQLNKADGKVLKVIHNGQEEQPSDDKVTIVSQNYTSVTVPAGTFKCIHIVAKTTQVKQLEAWINPKDTVMDGMLKDDMSTDYGFDLVMELTSFHKN